MDAPTGALCYPVVGQTSRRTTVETTVSTADLTKGEIHHLQDKLVCRNSSANWHHTITHRDRRCYELWWHLPPSPAFCAGLDPARIEGNDR